MPTHLLAKGANVRVADFFGDPDPTLEVTIRVSPPSALTAVDASVLVLGSAGSVQSGDDLVFYNQPMGIDGAVRLLVDGPVTDSSDDATNPAGAVALDIARLPDHVDRVVIAASVDAESGEHFGLAGSLDIDVNLGGDQANSTPIIRSELDGFTEERAIIVGELYRHDSGWKLRAVGQGYRDGLAALVTDFGVEVDEPQEAVDETDEESVLVEPSTESSVVHDENKVSIRRRKRVARISPDWRTRHSPYLLEPATEEGWTAARMFPAEKASSATEQETRATAVTLAVMEIVPEFGKRIVGQAGGPRGKIECFTEVRFNHANQDLRPDGLIRVTRGDKQWTALVEVKTAKGVLKADQVEAYVKLARAKGFDAVMTISCDIMPTADDLPVTVDARQLRTVALRHLSWEQILAEASVVSAHVGVDDRTRARVLAEYLRYGCDQRSGMCVFDDMGKHWVKVREGVKNSTLSSGDAATADVCRRFDQLGKHLAFQLSSLTGHEVTARPAAAHVDAVSRAKQLADSGELFGTLRVSGAVSPIVYHANLARERISCSTRVPAPRVGRSSTKANWLVRQLDKAPAGVRVTAHQLGSRTESASSLLEGLRDSTDAILPSPGKDIREFTVTLELPMGSKRSSDKGFVHAMTTLVNGFYETVVGEVRAPRDPE